MRQYPLNGHAAKGLLFQLDEAQLQKLDAWIAERNRKWLETQDAKYDGDLFVKMCTIDGIPYYGATGGALTYMFIPNSIGLVTKVRHADGEEINLTDYDSW